MAALDVINWIMERGDATSSRPVSIGSWRMFDSKDSRRPRRRSCRPWKDDGTIGGVARCPVKSGSGGERLGGGRAGRDRRRRDVARGAANRLNPPVTVSAG